MKTNVKRLFALLLTLCMLASLMVPVAFAEDEAVAAPSANVAETFPIRLFDTTQVDPATATGYNTWYLNSAGTSYKTQTVTALDTKIASAYAKGTLNWDFIYASGEYTFRADQAYQPRLSNKVWAALELRVSKGGVYALQFTTDKSAEPWTNEGTAWAGDVTAYLIPAAAVDAAIANAVVPEVAEGETAPAKEAIAIAPFMTEEYCIGTASMAADETSVTFPSKTRMEAGEYVLVYKASANNYCLAEIALVGEAYEMETVDTFALRPFDMTNYDTTTYAGTINEKMLVDGSFTDRLGSAAIINNAGLNFSVFTTSTDASTYLRASGAWQMDVKGGVLGIVINVAESGEMYLSLKTDKTDYAGTETPWSNSYKTFAADMQAWLIPYDVAIANGTTSAVKQAALATLTADDTYSLGVKHMFADKETVTFDKAYIEAGKYVVAFRALGEQGAWCEMSLSKVVTEKLPESEKVTGTVATYNFELYDTVEFANFFTTGVNEETGEVIMGNRGLTNHSYGSYEGYYEVDEGLQKVLDRNYANGQLNWSVAAYDGLAFLIRGADKDGVRIQKAAVSAPEGETPVPNSGWIALKVNVPVGGLYNANIVSEYGSNYSTNVYVLPAGADIASNLTEDNQVTTMSNQKGLNFRTTFNAGENLIVFKINETAKKATIYLSSLTLSVPDPATVSYKLDLINCDAFDAALSELSGGIVTEATTGNMRYREYINAEGASTRLYYYNAMANAFASGAMDWYLDTVQVGGLSTDTQYANYVINGSAEASNIRMKLEGATENDFGSIRIRVAQAGTYAISIAATCTKNDGVSAYIVPAPSNLTKHGDRIDAAFGDAAAVEANLMGSSDSNKGPITGNYTFDTAGEYIIILKHDNNEDGSIYVTSIDMTPVEASFIADGKGYETFEAAVAGATESIMMLANAEAGDVVIPAGVTLDLNGYTLYANSVDASAPGAQIVDYTDGKGVIRGEVEFNENNAQLPLYDIDTNTYKLFNVIVESCATTGNASATKYWFKINFTNEAAFDMIDYNSGLRIVASMTGKYKNDTGSHLAGEAWAAFATATIGFTDTWVANSSSYVVVSSVGSGISSFLINPGVSANGVIITGAAMGKG